MYVLIFFFERLFPEICRSVLERFENDEAKIHPKFHPFLESPNGYFVSNKKILVLYKRCNRMFSKHTDRKKKSHRDKRMTFILKRACPLKC